METGWLLKACGPVSLHPARFGVDALQLELLIRDFVGCEFGSVR